MHTNRRRALQAGVVAAMNALCAAGPARAAAPRLQAPNVVPISPRLVTSGQPGADALARLGELGFQAVVYLAPPSVPDAVREEPELLARQGIQFLNIPIPFGDPQATHAEALFAALQGWRERQVLVHCQVNMRASSLVFLYRAIVLKEPPEAAYEAVARVWSPHGPWRRLLLAQLRQHGIGFEPY